MFCLYNELANVGYSFPLAVLFYRKIEDSFVLKGSLWLFCFIRVTHSCTGVHGESLYALSDY